MYSYFKGVISEINPKYITIDVNNIGYLVQVKNPFQFKVDQELVLYIYQSIKDDGISLFGFLTKEEKNLFILLLSVKGIGPKSALSILASGDFVCIKKAIESDDISYLTKFPGIGQKVSQQIILDLKGKLISLEKNKNTNLDDCIEALLSLGYKKNEISKIVDNLDQTKPVELLLKDALKLMLH